MLFIILTFLLYYKQKVELFNSIATYLADKSAASLSSKSKHPQQRCVELLRELNSSSSHAFLVHDRFINMPLQLIYHLHSNLLDDYNWICKEAAGSDKLDKTIIRKFKGLESIIVFSPCEASESDTNVVEDVVGSSHVMFHFIEDEMYFSHATEAFKVNISPKIMKNQHYILMMVPINKLKNVVEDMRILLDN